METTASGVQQDALQAALGGHYALERELGRGGMATVWLARDLRHHRLVAVKVLHPELGAMLGPERFLREIELTAGLQHPHVLPLFDSGAAGGVLGYVMPYVDGETLRARLARERQLPVDDAVRIARQVADALAYAHARGVIHRDVKPENVLLHGGHALVADFGVALAVQEAGGQRMTQTGLSLGTPQYMAPEQTTGERVIDHRADVYALGAVLYEMLAGEPPFTGPTAQAVIAKALTSDPPPLARERRSVPPHVEAVVRRALEKLPADRFASAAAFADALLVPGVLAPVGQRPRRQLLLAASALVAATALGWVAGRATYRAPPPRPVRFTIELDSGALRFGEVAISPDGQTIVYTAEYEEGTRLYARRIREINARPLAGTENADLPFFSPDGAWVAYYANGALQKVPLDGGAPVVIAPVPLPAWFVGGAWGEDGYIYYASGATGALHRVPSSGGRPTRLAVADTTAYVLGPRPVPGGRALLVTVIYGGGGVGRIGVLELASGRLREFSPGLGARYVDGHLVFQGVRGDLYRQPFDLRRLEPTGRAIQVVSGVSATPPLGRFGFDVTASGVLVHHEGGRQTHPGTRFLSLLDSTGRTVRVIPSRFAWEPRFSPDGRRVAYGDYAPGRDSSDVWVADVETGEVQQLTSDGHDNNDPVWSPDGTQIVFDKLAPGGKDLYVQPAAGGPVRLLLRRPGTQWPTDWTRDGTLLFTEDTAHTNINVLAQPIGGGEASPVATSPGHESAARMSPDGRWVAYQSDESGRYEIYVQSYPAPGRRTPVSLGGGVNPVWRRDGRVLYYWRVDRLMAARLEDAGPSKPLAVKRRDVVFRARYVENVLAMYDVAPDGSRFVVVTSESRPGRLVVALDAFR